LQQIQPSDVQLEKKEQENDEQNTDNQDGFFANLCKVFACGYLPNGSRTTRDKSTFGKFDFHV
jgi:hypothetical protein